jgi:hypothetical protein
VGGQAGKKRLRWIHPTEVPLILPGVRHSVVQPHLQGGDVALDRRLAKRRLHFLVRGHLRLVHLLGKRGVLDHVVVNRATVYAAQASGCTPSLAFPQQLEVAGLFTAVEFVEFTGHTKRAPCASPVANPLGPMT